MQMKISSLFSDFFQPSLSPAGWRFFSALPQAYPCAAQDWRRNPTAQPWLSPAAAEKNLLPSPRSSSPIATRPCFSLAGAPSPRHLPWPLHASPAPSSPQPNGSSPRRSLPARILPGPRSSHGARLDPLLSSVPWPPRSSLQAAELPQLAHPMVVPLLLAGACRACSVSLALDAQSPSPAVLPPVLSVVPPSSVEVEPTSVVPI
jgi:hypothetical protein